MIKIITSLIHDFLMLREEPSQIVGEMVVDEWLDRLSTLEKKWLIARFILRFRSIRAAFGICAVACLDERLMRVMAGRTNRVYCRMPFQLESSECPSYRLWNLF
jgi:hypothetical protein